MLHIHLETQLKLDFSNIILVIITTSIVLSNNTKILPFKKFFENAHFVFYL